MRSMLLSVILGVLCQHQTAVAFQDVDLGTVTEKHQMIPMRDGKHLSAYLYFPPGEGPWPVLFEQRYADIRGAGTRQSRAKLAEAGYVVAMVNYRGTHQSEGTWVGYRALGWGELKDGYDTCEWLGTQSWSTGKVGTFGSSQAGYAQNFLAITQPPHLTAQYMVDTGLSLFHEGYRIGGTTRPARFKSLASGLPRSSRQRSPAGGMVDASALRRLLARRGLLAALRQNERAVLHDRQLVRLHESGLDRQLSGPPTSRRTRTRAAGSS